MRNFIFLFVFCFLLSGCLKTVIDGMAPPQTRVAATEVAENNVHVFDDTRPFIYVVNPPLEGVVVTYAEGVNEYVTDKFRQNLIERGILPKSEVTGELKSYTTTLSDFQWDWTANVELVVNCNGCSQEVSGTAIETNWTGTKDAVESLDEALADAFSKLDYSKF